jgi:uncharacterized phiE125 gp8 family phage protein
MPISYKRLNTPTGLAVSIEETQQHLRIVEPDAAELAFLNNLILTAQNYCESYCRRVFEVADFVAYLDSFPVNGMLLIQKSPVIEVTEIKYKDAAGVEQTLLPSAYEVDTVSEPARIRFKTMPALSGGLNAISIKFKAGYANDAKEFDATLIPRNIKSAMLLIIGHLYEHREQVVVGTIQGDIDFGVDRLLASERVFLF